MGCGGCIGIPTTTPLRVAVVSEGGHICGCGATGCLETVVGLRGLLEATGAPTIDAIIHLLDDGDAHAGRTLVAAARALALINGRDYVLPTDVQAVGKDVMAHRIVLGFDAVADGVNTAEVVDRILAMVPAPTPVWNQEQRQASQRFE